MGNENLIVRIEGGQEYLVSKEEPKQHGETVYKRRVIRLSEEDVREWERLCKEISCQSYRVFPLWMITSLGFFSTILLLFFSMLMSRSDWGNSMTWILTFLLITAVGGFFCFRSLDKYLLMVKNRMGLLTRHGYDWTMGRVGGVDAHGCPVVLLPTKSEFD